MAGIDQGVVLSLSFGFVLGLRHALEPDHMATVSTIVSERPGLRGPSLVALWWGIGHAFALSGLGIAVVAWNLSPPPQLDNVLESLVAVILIALGIRAIWLAPRGAVTPLHDEIAPHSSPRWRPLLVGMLHGSAGSGAVVLLLLAALPMQRLAFMVSFSVGSLGGMLLMSILLGLCLTAAARLKSARFCFQVVLGMASAVLGLSLLWHPN